MLARDPTGTKTGWNIQNNQLDSITKGNVDQGADGVTQTAGDTLRSMAQQAGQRDDGHSIESEDDDWTQARGCDGNTGGYKNQQHIDPAMADGSLCVADEAHRTILHANK